MSKRFSIKELKTPDKFFKTMLKFVGYLRTNVKAYLTFSAVIVVITLAYVLIENVNDKREQKAMTVLYEVSKEMRSMGSSNPEDYIKLIEGKLDQLGSTKAGMEARYMLAEFYYDKGDWEKAVTYYDHVADNSNGLLEELSMLGSAYSLEKKGDFKGALNKFEELRELNSPVYKAVSMMGVGRCYQKLGDKTNALSAYESVIISFPDTDYAKMASVSKASL